MTEMKSCPECQNNNEFTFHFHYAPHPTRKSLWDETKGMYVCLDCGYRSKSFGLENSIPKIKNNERSFVVNVSPAPVKKVKLTIEINRSDLDAIMSSFERRGFNNIQVSF